MRLLLALLVFAVGAGPLRAAPDSAPTDAPSMIESAQEAALRTSVTAWWTAREHRDLRAMYELMEPGYRERVALAEFLRANVLRTRFELAGNRIERIVAESPNRARVTLSVETHVPRFPDTRVSLEETWIRVADAWFKVYQPPALPFPALRSENGPAQLPRRTE